MAAYTDEPRYERRRRTRLCRGRLCRSADPRALVDRDDADAALVDADCAQRPLHDLNAAVEIERHAEREYERRADHVAVADDDRSRVAVALGDIEDRLDGAELHRPHRLAAGNSRQTAALVPRVP